MAVNNYQMLRNQRLRDQPTSVFGMQRAARNIGQQARPQTNTNPMQPPPVSTGGNQFPTLPGQQQTPTGLANFRPPTSTNNLARPSLPGSGTGWNSASGPHTLEQAAGGRYYQDGSTWYSNSPMNPQAHMNQGGPRVSTPPQMPGQQQTGTLAQRPQFGNAPVQQAPMQTMYSQSSGATNANSTGSNSNPTTKRSAITSTGTSGSGLAKAGSSNTNDTVNNGVTPEDMLISQRADAFDNNGVNDWSVDAEGSIVGKDGRSHGNIYDPNSWDSDARSFVDTWNGTHSDKIDATTQSYGGGNKTTPDQLAQQNAGNQTPMNIQQWMEQYGLGQPPQFDQRAVDKLNSATNANYMRQQGRSLQAATELQSRAGASADQMAGSMGDVTSAYGMQSAQEQARNNLQVQTQNFQQQTDYYNKQFQIGMSLFADAQSDQDRDYAFKYAQKMLQLGEESQKKLIAYQNDLQNQITGKDILGMLLGAGTQIGGAALGGYMAGGAGGVGALTASNIAGDVARGYPQGGRSTNNGGVGNNFFLRGY